MMATCDGCLHKEVCFTYCEKQHKEEGCATCSIRMCGYVLSRRVCEYFASITRGRAYWIIDKGGQWAECSHCHEASKLSAMEHKDCCPACGAIMDEESVVIHP